MTVVRKPVNKYTIKPTEIKTPAVSTGATIAITTPTSNETLERLAQYGFNRARVELIKDQIAKGCTDLELEMFLMTCNRTGLDPFSRQVYMIRRWNKDATTPDKKVATIQISIDGFRAIASAHPDYAGQTPTMFCGKDGKWVEVWTGDASKGEFPFAAKVGIYRKGYSEATYAIAKWDSYVQTYENKNDIAPMWRKFPELMLGKCGEAQALRKAFPKQLSGFYTPDEMAQADNNVIEVESTPVKAIGEPVMAVKTAPVAFAAPVSTPAPKTAELESDKEPYTGQGKHREIFKDLIAQLNCIKNCKSKEEKAPIYKDFNEKSMGVPLCFLEEHLKNLDEEAMHA